MPDSHTLPVKPVEGAHRRLTRFEDSAASAAATRLELPARLNLSARPRTYS
jgi:hypothetical protein